jgi:ATP-dependent Zn protease
MDSDLLSLFSSWFPFIVLMIVWIWLFRTMGQRWRSPSGATWGELTEQQVTEIRRMNATLERIAVALEKRAQGA